MSSLLRMEGIQKSFPGVLAIREGRLALEAGEIHALLGENGAGKSTLLKVLSGAHQPDAGTIHLNGEQITIAGPRDATERGIAVIYQEFNLIPQLSVAENLFLGREKTKGGFITRADENAAAQALLTRLAAPFQATTPVGELTVAQQQLVEIAKALSQNAKILVMDEPTAALSGREVDALFAIVRDLKAQGIGIVYVSHRLDEIFQLCDTATVMRDGQWIATKPVSEWTRPKLIESMVGRALSAEFPPRDPAQKIGEARLVVKNLTRGKFVQDVSFELRRGEILGLSGLVGAGRTEVARLLFGADLRDSGEVILDGKPLPLRSPQDAVKAGICLLTEDRKRQGLVLDLALRGNFGLPNLESLGKLGFVDGNKEREAFGGYVQSLLIKTPHQEQLARNLSGGNQQKVVLAKWLQANSEILIFDEPTRGVDVGAKYEIYVLMRKLATEGKAILMISSELPEVLGMSDRILVMRGGKLTGEIEDATKATQEDVLHLAVE
ncbi:sugar ABC transporter ATP-binding protein [Armatimonas rosea]|uniref:ABC-type sugar transport system ATPase subunit n=1 Tax=Armatimonas rosea TaxID=685828 RepID=A0A7W9SNC7_ARMRO|nr:sugar ABC transporter ATP-binding protein [Armatimonas rosea]MBB6049805.1 ABC-type sugar transport system ATPase subunit [Armatimonas rosea]